MNLVDLQPAPYNPRAISDAALAGLQKSLHLFGDISGLVWNSRTGHLVAGHQRLRALQEQHGDALTLDTTNIDGREQPAAVTLPTGEFFPVRVVDWDEPTERAANIAANATTIQGEFTPALGPMLEELRDTFPAFDDLMFDDLTWPDPPPLDPPEDPGPQLDKAGELQEKWQTARGQVWTIPSATGPLSHRLMCGDCTVEADVAALMLGAKADAVLTDPPYGVGWAYESFEDTEENLERLVRGFMPVVQKLADVVLVTCGNKNQHMYPRADWVLAWFCPAGIGRGPWGFTCWQPVLAYGADPYLKAGMGSRPDAFVLQESASSDDHPCAKPLGVWAWLLQRASAKKGDLVFDPFLGSGTTMVACENLGRVCYGMDIEPKYVAVTLQRMADMGLAPTLESSYREGEPQPAVAVPNHTGSPQAEG